MTFKYDRISLSIDSDRRAILKELARKHNCFHGQEPSISELMKEIADGKIPLGDRVHDFAEVKRSRLRAVQAIEEIENK